MAKSMNWGGVPSKAMITPIGRMGVELVNELSGSSNSSRGSQTPQRTEPQQLGGCGCATVTVQSPFGTLANFPSYIAYMYVLTLVRL